MMDYGREVSTMDKFYDLLYKLSNKVQVRNHVLHCIEQSTGTQEILNESNRFVKWCFIAQPYKKLY